MSFVHLHMHTQFSLLDGAIRLADLFNRCVELGFTSVAMTDHGNMYGTIKFYEGARKAGLKPIIGCETYVAPNGRLERKKGKSPHHLVLLARNNEGLANLSRLVSLGFLEGFYVKPRIDREILTKYSKGLIGLSACLSGEIPRLLLAGKTDEAHKAALAYQEIFEPDSFYLEMQKNGMVEQDRVNEGLCELSEATGIPLVATNDCHYLRREDHEAHEVLMCIQTGKKLEDEKRMRLSTDQFYIKSEEEMYEQFKGHEQALENTVKIADACNISIKMGEFMLPEFPAPEGESTDSFLARMATENLTKHLEKLRAGGGEPDPVLYQKRLEYELGVIQKMGFSDYYLIVWDFINQARKMGIAVGPGRGSGAGSLVAFTVGITKLDPIRFDLLFERFLNPARLDMPDFDIDFCKRKRDKIIEYVTQFYGKERVSQIATYSSLNPKAAVRDVGRVLGFSFKETDTITKLFPDGPEAAKTTIATQIQTNSKIRRISEQDDRHKKLFKIASALEKLNRQAGIHAAGVVIAREPLIDVAPLWTGKNGEVVCQYAKEELEKVGLVKFDFLGLKTLTVIDESINLIRRNDKTPPDLDELPLDLPEVYSLISSGQTHGVFQMESDGFRRLVRNLGPDRFDDIIAVLALYRPGPLGGGMVDTYVNRKHGLESIDYGHKLLEPVLKDTYGVIVYQEQVMRISSEIAGFNMSKADELRKAMAKKKIDKMAILRDEFIAGGLERGHSKTLLAKLMNTLEQFGEYGFNKSHSAAYAYISYWTAYLKANFPVEFMAALTSLDKNDPVKMVSNLAECRRMEIRVRVPHINKSDMDFTVSGDEILFGLSGIKNVGVTAVEAILKERDANGEFKDFYNFLVRVDSQRVNKRVVEGLVNAGAFDCFTRTRRTLLTNLDQTLSLAQSEQKDRAIGQKSLFAARPPASAQKKRKHDTASVPKSALYEPDFIDRETLHAEKEAIGFYLSGHPLDGFLGIIGELTSHLISDVQELGNGTEVVVAGVVRSISEKQQKRGTGVMARIELEDRFGVITVMAFSTIYEPSRDIVQGREPIIIRGRVKAESAQDDDRPDRRTVELLADSISLFAEEAARSTRAISLDIRADTDCSKALLSLQKVVRTYQGSIPLQFQLEVPGRGRVRMQPHKDYCLRMHEDALQAISTLVGKHGIRFLVNR
jgi:DNA polymerase III subunit alpha